MQKQKFLVPVFSLSIFFFSLADIAAQSTAAISDSVLVVGIKPAPPFVIFHEEDGTVSGLSIYLWDRATSEANIKFTYKRYQDVPQLLEALEHGEIDLTINPLTVTKERILKMDFSQPYYISSMGIAMRKENNWFLFLKNFFSIDFFRATLLLLGIVLFFGLLIWLVERGRNSEQFPKGIAGVGQGFWWSAVTMTTVGYGDRAPITFVGRLVAFIWMFAAIILISGITASIASSLTVNTLATQINSINNIRELNAGTLVGSSSHAYLKSNRIPVTEYNSIADALNALASKEIDAVVYDKPILQYYITEGSHDKGVQVLEKTFTQDYYSFAFPRGSQIDDILNPIIIEQIYTADWAAEKEKYHP